MPSASDLLADRLTAQGVDLLRLESSVRQRVLGQIRLLERDLGDKIQRADINSAKRITTRRRRADKLLRDGRKIINSRYLKVTKLLRKELKQVAGYAFEESAALYNGFLRGDFITIGRAPGLDRVMHYPLDDWWLGQRRATSKAFVQSIEQSLIQGNTPSKAVEAFRGSKTGRASVYEISGKKVTLSEFSGGLFQASRTNASTLIQSSVQGAANKAMASVYEDNPDLFRGIQALVTLDRRTSLICIERAGAAWSVIDGAALPESSVDYAYPGPAPWHFRCRTIMLGILLSYEQMKSSLDEERLQLLEKLPKRVKQSLNGKMAADLDSEQWLKERGRVFAREKLGPGRYDLWEAGKITTHQLIDQSGRPITVAELKQRNSA